MLAVQVVRAPPSSVVVYTVVLVVPMSVFASEIGAWVELASAVLAVSVIVIVDPPSSVVA